MLVLHLLYSFLFLQLYSLFISHLATKGLFLSTFGKQLQSLDVEHLLLLKDYLSFTGTGSFVLGLGR